MNQLQTLLSHLPDDKIRELDTVTDRIQKTAKAHIVILFGSYARGDYKLERGLERGKKSDYDLLVITADSDSRRAISLELARAFDDIAHRYSWWSKPSLRSMRTFLSVSFSFLIFAGKELCCTIRDNTRWQNQQKSVVNNEEKWLRMILRTGSMKQTSSGYMPSLVYDPI